MFKNSIVVLNIGNVLCDNARNSILNACKRWNCNFYEITKNRVDDKNIWINKIVGIYEYYQLNPNVERIMYLDADILIRDDAPNPFELLDDKDKVYAVLDYNDGWATKELYIHRMIEPRLRIVHDNLKYNVDINNLISTSCDWFFNAGMFILSPLSCKYEMDTFINNIPFIWNNPHLEQPMWNYILKCSNKVELIDSTWNLLNPQTNFNKMDAYIYHFTGTRFVELKPLLPCYNWKTEI
jgi:hypothetical protein